MQLVHTYILCIHPPPPKCLPADRVHRVAVDAAHAILAPGAASQAEVAALADPRRTPCPGVPFLNVVTIAGVT
jgi:hypothetical protein